MPEPSRKRRQLVLLAAAEVLAMSLWFSGSAVLPQVTADWSLTPAAQSWMTMSVQLGFVAGAFCSALLNLPDRFPAQRVFAAGALVAALSNLGIVATADHLPATLALRFATGAALAGVYPPGMKLMASWCREDRGFGIGLLVGALTLGSGAPHLLNALAGDGLPDWRAVLMATSGLSLVSAGLAAGLLRPGPHLGSGAPFDWRFAARAVSHPPTRLANLGYLGHMWELYAMWAWVPILLIESYAAAGRPGAQARLAGFGVLAAGAVGCVVAGRWADRWGRTAVTAAALAGSGLCALGAGWLVHRPLLLTALCLVWGFLVVADSAQFSAAVSELTEPRYVGSALTLQTALGFLLTLLTIRLVPALETRFGWTLALAALAVGPAFGIASMLRLRARPEARQMANGRR